MQLTKQQLYSFTKYAYKLLKKHPELFSVEKMRIKRGLCVYDEKNMDDAIMADYRDLLLPSFIHEICHYRQRHPERKDETIVAEMESAYTNQLSKRQAIELLFRLTKTLRDNMKKKR